jgi:putative heme iron utilization protein
MAGACDFDAWTSFLLLASSTSRPRRTAARSCCCRLAAHTRHLEADPRLSLLLAQTGAGDPLTHPRITIVGIGECIFDPDRRAVLKARFLAKHPKSALYADFADFSYWRNG